MACDTSCISPIPVLSYKPCINTKKRGGISRVIFVRCSADLTDVLADPCDSDAWKAIIDAGDMRITNEVVGSKAARSFTSALVASCRPEEAINATSTYTISDKNFSQSFNEFDFYNDVSINARNYLVAVVDCNGRIYGFNEYSMQYSHVIPENGNTDIQSHDYTLTIQGLEETKPFVAWSGLVQYLIQTQNFDYTTPSDPQIVADELLDCSSISLRLSDSTISGAPGDGVTFDLSAVSFGCALGTLINTRIEGLPSGYSLLAPIPTPTGTPASTTINIPLSATVGDVVLLEIKADSSTAGCNVNSVFLQLTVTA